MSGFHRACGWIAGGLVALLPAPGMLNAAAAPEPARIVRARYLMGTVFRFTAAPSEAAATALDAALDEVQRLEGILSNWNPGSELSRLNGAAGRGPAPVSPDLLRAVEAALHWARETEGSFDPTVEPLTRHSRMKASGGGTDEIGAEAPAPERVVGWRRIIVDRRALTVEIPAGGGIDLGGIGKGIALDSAAEVLRRHGIHEALLDAGGQFLALGSPETEKGWRVALADPEDRQQPSYTFLLRDVSMATSGNAERPGEIVDPQRGSQVMGRYSATSFAPDATAADALSTSLFVLGPARGEVWAGRRTDLFALYLNPAGDRENPPLPSGTLRPALEHDLVVSGSVDRDGQRRLHVELP
jgi:thiamine biosynthesis lipoprotein